MTFMKYSQRIRVQAIRDGHSASPTAPDVLAALMAIDVGGQRHQGGPWQWWPRESWTHLLIGYACLARS